MGGAGREFFFSNFEKRQNNLLGNVVGSKHTKFEEDRSIFTLSNCGGTQKLSKFMGEGEDFFPNFEKRRNTLLGNAVRNKHTKFEQDRSTGSVLKIGGKKSREKEKIAVLDPKIAYLTKS